MAKVRIMHYMNQFFAGLGGEDKADVPLAWKEGSLGPGRRLQALLGDAGQIVVTTYCGDNYFAPHSAEVLASIVRLAGEHKVDMLIAGPAFASGRHGFACVEVCHAVSTSLGLNCITGLYPENPGVDTYRAYHDRNVFAFPTTEAVAGMEDALSRMAKCAVKLAGGTVMGPAAAEGYITRGLRFNRPQKKSGAERAVDMLLDKIAGNPFTTEIPLIDFQQVPASPAIQDMKKAKIALVTTMGVVPPGNPDGFKIYRNTQWRKYPIGELNSMQDSKWNAVHGGYTTPWVTENANYAVPLDAARALEKEGAFGNLYPYFYITTGNMGFVTAMQEIGAEIARDMKTEGIDAAILTSA